MEQIWALTHKDGRCSLVITKGPRQHPADCGNRDACKGRTVWALDREPLDALCEVVDHNTGKIVIDPFKVAQLVAEIKQAAALKIAEISPTWKQQNDIRYPTSEGALRFARIDAIRDWSNFLEKTLHDDLTVEALAAVRAALTDPQHPTQR